MRVVGTFARAAVACAALVVVAGCASAAAPSSNADATHDSLAKIRARGTLLLPTDPAYPASSLRGIEPAAYVGIPAGALDRSASLTLKPLYDLVNKTLTARFADGTLKQLSMHYFGHDYATAAQGIDPANFGQDVR